MPTIPIKVNSYSGYKAEEEPVSFTIGQNTLNVEEIIDRWFGEGHEYFKLRAEDGYIYIIRYDRELDEWELTMMERAERPE